jgi:glycosyltransferase involved in cell wall biosynthesis
MYRNARIVIVPLYPSRHASGYAVIAEAMAMGKPVIATRTASPSDLIEEGVTGFYVEPGDSEEIQRKILQLLKDPELARQMGQAGRRRMVEQFSVEAYTERIEGVITDFFSDNHHITT